MEDKVKMLAALIAISAAAAVTLAAHKRTESRLRELDRKIQEQSLELSRRAAGNSELSAAIEANSNNLPLTGKKLSALLKLRNEAAQLRRTNAEMARLESRNRKLRASLESNQTRLAAAKMLPNYWAKDQLSYCGFADPSSAVKSILALMSKGDAESWQAACTPEAIGKLRNEWKNSGLSTSQQEAEFKSMADGLMSSCDGFHIIDTSQPDPDTEVVQLSFDGQNTIRKIVLKRIEDQWKMNDLGAGSAGAAFPN